MDRNVEYFQEDSNGLTIQNQKGQWISHWLSVWANGMKNDGLDVPGGSVVKNLPANTGNTGSIPAQGRSHMHEQLSL